MQVFCDNVISDGDLTVDVNPGPNETEDNPAEIWICENMEGGGGAIEYFSDKYYNDEKLFFEILN